MDFLAIASLLQLNKTGCSIKKKPTLIMLKYVRTLKYKSCFWRISFRAGHLRIFFRLIERRPFSYSRKCPALIFHMLHNCDVDENWKKYPFRHKLHEIIEANLAFYNFYDSFQSKADKGITMMLDNEAKNEANKCVFKTLFRRKILCNSGHIIYIYNFIYI